MQAPRQVTNLSAAISAALPTESPRPVYLTVEQFSERNPPFTQPALRNLIFKADSRQSSKGTVRGNGLAEAGAIIRLGRRVLIDEAKFLAWVAQAGSAVNAHDPLVWQQIVSVTPPELLVPVLLHKLLKPDEPLPADLQRGLGKAWRG